MKFRQKHKVDELHNWDIPEVLLNGIPYGTTGCDKDGSILIIIPFKGTDAYGLFHASSKQEVVKYILRLAEGKLGVFEVDCFGIKLEFDFLGYDIMKK